MGLNIYKEAKDPQKHILSRTAYFSAYSFLGGVYNLILLRESVNAAVRDQPKRRACGRRVDNRKLPLGFPVPSFLQFCAHLTDAPLTGSGS